ncbi:ABC transporter permease [Hydrogenophaga sp.]|jgi:ribose transport system permease protein|uniref:ABC transporter permease n=1 Tax=Hydrogenophaga sp. TaxID=1904254 RepID=UPI002721325F|nr:ABC transporter permease [Hydrogenophaga sp.]MDO9250877.1 ABC transporter permease [Hydrogenophaga sp.]MDP3324957.1 ABC transporter permease [Hydrogenophaga sp.]MDP3885272.1 ABC transporter permease [Hydrogenophaga sp.]
MSSTSMPKQAVQSIRTAAPVLSALRSLFVRLGVLPFMMVIAFAVFSSLSDQFLTVQNLVNLLRQSVYLILVSLGQMLALVTGGFDLSVGTVMAITSVVSALAMQSLGLALPDAAWLVIVAGCACGVLAGLTIGLVNGIGVAVFGVSPFIMTLGVQSIGFGIALFLTGGVPVSGLPGEFSDLFGFGSFLGVPIPILVTALCVLGMGVLMSRLAIGTHLLAVGGNARAAALSGIDTRRTLLVAYLLCAGLAAVSGLLLTARVDTGEANLGGSVALESIAACVIAGVSLRGGMGRVPNVVMGAIFIGLVQNGMNLASVGSYLQMVVLGVLLIVAVVADQVRHRMVVPGSH